MNSHYYSVIMAGGIGSRFWPLSRTSVPKQFLDIMAGGKSLFQQTFERFGQVCPVENIYVVTNEIYKDAVLTQVPQIRPEQVVCEPMRRNTAPCIAYACNKIYAIDPDAVIVVSPSDHLITNETEFVEVIENGLKFVATGDLLLTLGIKPHRIETGYGYIQLKSSSDCAGHRSISKVKTFTEKPNYELAKAFFESGEYFWNSGIFVWTARAVLSAFEQHAPEIDTLFREGVNAYNTPTEADYIREAYSRCPNISIDYAIMEKADNVYVQCADFGWSDLGSWESLYDNSQKDANANVVHAPKAIIEGTTNTYIRASDGKLVVVCGMDDCIIVEKDNVLLVARRNQDQQLRQVVSDVKIKYGDEFI